jgi:hypothetical protein
MEQKNFSFSAESDLPLTLGLLVDTSGSTRNVLGDERSASYRSPQPSRWTPSVVRDRSSEPSDTCRRNRSKAGWRMPGFLRFARHPGPIRYLMR